MSFLQKYYIMAENQLNERKSRNKELQLSRIQETEQKIPELKELRKCLMSGGSRLAAVLVAEKDPKEAVKEISKENMAIGAKIKELLVKNGYKPDYLDPIYSCDKCSDAGIYNDKRCSCFMNDVIKLQCDDLNKSSALNLCTFDSFDLNMYKTDKINSSGLTIRECMEECYGYCVQFAKDFHLPQNGILMIGGTGLGKTHLSLSIGNEVIKKGGYSVIYGSAPDLFSKIEKEHFGNAPDMATLQILQDCDLLIFDDLGAEFDSKFNQSTLYNLLNTRLNNGKPIIINSNFTLTELQDRYGGRIMSRILVLKDLHFYGSDIRIAKKFNV